MHLSTVFWFALSFLLAIIYIVEGGPFQLNTVEETTLSEAAQDETDKNVEAATQRSMNSFVDFLLTSFALMVNGMHLQPLKFNDSGREFEKKVFGFRIHGEATLYNTTLTDGLQTIYRVDNASLSKNSNATAVERALQFTVGLHNVRVDTNFRLKFLGLGPNLHFQAETEQIDILVVFSVVTDNTGKSASFELEKLNVVNLVPFVYTIQGLWIFNYPAKIFTTIMSKLCKKMITRNLEKEITELMNRVVKESSESPATQQMLSMFIKTLQ